MSFWNWYRCRDGALSFSLPSWEGWCRIPVSWLGISQKEGIVPFGPPTPSERRAAGARFYGKQGTTTIVVEHPKVPSTPAPQFLEHIPTPISAFVDDVDIPVNFGPTAGIIDVCWRHYGEFAWTTSGEWENGPWHMFGDNGCALGCAIKE